MIKSVVEYTDYVNKPSGWSFCSERCHKHDIRRCVRCPRNGDTNVGLLQSEGVIHSIARNHLKL